MKCQSSINVCVVVLSFAFCLLSFSSPIYAVVSPVSYEITVSATIGEPKLILFGYTSPNALVELKGIRVSEETIANKEGYFFFDRIFLPPPSPEYPELCLTSIDTQNRISFPTCLPPLPTGPYEITVGPVLLPPTISLEKGNFLPLEQIAALGATIPNTEVTIYLANDLSTGFLASAIYHDRGVSSRLKLAFITPVYAYSLPKYQIQADNNGHFEFNLPANQPATWRVFAGSFYLGSPTPKSNTLTFKVLSWWQSLWQKIKEFLMLLLGFLRPYLWLLIILGEITVVILLWRRHKTAANP